MAYGSPHVLFPFPASIAPRGTQIFDMRLAGIGTKSPAIGTNFSPGKPPQSGANALLTHPVGVSHGADCPTCNLVEIPYNPNLPRIRM
jgi:hypothetical protein